MELHVEPVIPGILGEIIDQNVNADGDSYHDLHYYPDGNYLSSSKIEAAEDDALIWME